MSLVTTPSCQSARKARQSASVRAVLPEPTGPPMPTRSGPRGRESPTEESGVLGFMVHRREGKSRQQIAATVERAGGGGRGQRFEPAAEAGQQALSGALTERYRLERREHGVLEPAPQVADERIL